MEGRGKRGTGGLGSEVGLEATSKAGPFSHRQKRQPTN